MKKLIFCAKKILGKIENPKGSYMTQTELVNNMVNLTGLKKKEAKNALAAFRTIGNSFVTNITLLLVLHG